MMTPASRPTTTESDTCHHWLVSVPKSHAKMPNVATAIRQAAVLVPIESARRSSFIPAPSLVRTRYIPMIESSTPQAAMSEGARTAFICIPSTAEVAKAEAPRAIVARMDPAYDSYRSAPIPATSPTLSPTLSAIVAGLRGSSSGMLYSVLPTRSAPTSAALV